MSNMSYCRWENTYMDLRDCLESMGEVETKDLSEREKRYKEKVLKACDEYRLLIDGESEEEESEEEESEEEENEEE